MHARRACRTASPLRLEEAILRRLVVRALPRVASVVSRTHLATAGIIAALALGAGLASSYSVAPPLGSTGAPGEVSTSQCIHCHADYPLNGGSGTLSVTTGADSFVTGGQYTCTVQLTQPGQQRWGFELVARTPTGVNAGYFAPVDGMTSSQRDFSSEAGFVYAYQNIAGTFAGQNSATWTLSWTAPTDPEVTAVTIYAAAVAADGIGESDAQGDYVYTTTTSLHLAATPARPTTWGRVKALYLSGATSATGAAPARCPATGATAQ